ncbi:unnamed protein product, partial [Ixodes hexagonus]
QYFSDASCKGLSIVSRKGWGARSPRRRVPMRPLSAKYVIIHHTTGSSCNSLSTCRNLMKGFQKYHMDTHRWPDIGYSFLVGGDGRIYEGRGWGWEGAHTRGYNHNGIAISFIGDFSHKSPNQKMLDAAKKLIVCGVKNGHISKHYSLHGHRNANCTSCPGNALYKLIVKWARFGGNLKKFC